MRLGSLQVFRSLGHQHSVLRIVVAYTAFAVCEFATWIAMLVYAYEQGGPTTAAVVAVAQLLPAAGVALLMGPLADRRSPAVVLIGGYAVQALGMGATAVLLLIDAAPIAVYVAAVVGATAIAATRPAQSALVPALTSEADQLMACNVVIGWVENLSLLLAGVATGVALTFGSVADVYVGAALLMAIATFLVLPLRRLPFTRRTKAERGMAATESTAQLLRHDSAARLLVCLIGAEFLVIGALDLLFVVMAVDVLDAGAAWAGYLNTAYGAGALVFGALAALLIGRRLGPVVLATAVVLGLALAASTISGLAVVMVLLAVVGGARALLDVSVRVLLQRTVPPHRLAGVFGVAEGLLMIGLAAGSLLVPFLMSFGGATLAMLGTAAILPALVLVSLPLLMRLDQHARVPVVEISLLRQLPLFTQLPATPLAAVAQRLERIEFEPGATLVREGEIGEHYYAIADGDVTVLRRGRPIARLGRADGMGEIALMRSVPRTATAVAETPVLAYRLDRDAFMEAVTGHRAVFELAEEIVRGHADRDAARDAAREQPPAAES